MSSGTYTATANVAGQIGRVSCVVDFDELDRFDLGSELANVILGPHSIMNQKEMIINWAKHRHGGIYELDRNMTKEDLENSVLYTRQSYVQRKGGPEPLQRTSSREHSYAEIPDEIHEATASQPSIRSASAASVLLREPTLEEKFRQVHSGMAVRVKRIVPKGAFGAIAYYVKEDVIDSEEVAIPRMDYGSVENRVDVLLDAIVETLREKGL